MRCLCRRRDLDEEVTAAVTGLRGKLSRDRVQRRVDPLRGNLVDPLGQAVESLRLRPPGAVLLVLTYADEQGPAVDSEAREVLSELLSGAVASADLSLESK